MDCGSSVSRNLAYRPQGGLLAVADTDILGEHEPDAQCDAVADDECVWPADAEPDATSIEFRVANPFIDRDAVVYAESQSHWDALYCTHNLADPFGGTDAIPATLFVGHAIGLPAFNHVGDGDGLADAEPERLSVGHGDWNAEPGPKHQSDTVAFADSDAGPDRHTIP